MYLLFGEKRVLLLDTGAVRSAARLPIGSTVRNLVAERSTDREPLMLLVAHTHSHGDHVGGDPQFEDGPHVRRARLGIEGVERFFGIGSWPEQIVTLDLGGRAVDVIPTPGHEESHITLYDRNTEVLLTGDTLYPGLLYVRDLGAYRSSVERLARFIESNEYPVEYILGAHIEMKNSPGKFFGYPHPFFQPDEHSLELGRRHLFELRDVVRSMGPDHETVRHADFIVFHAGPGNTLPPEDE
jgi:hydroxyacylglutathione hydrolase